MILRRFAVFALALFAVPAAASSRESIDPGVMRVFTPPSALERVIVEFRGAPSALGVSALDHGEVFARFRRDLAAGGEAAAAKAGTAAPSIEHEYSRLFFGAAVSIRGEEIDRLRRLPYVRAVHRDTVVRAYQTAGPVDARIGVNARNLGARGAGQVVAVIDTGIDYTHPALGGGFGPGFKVIGGWDFVHGDADPMDDHGHGTHVAGTVAANAADLIGVAPDAKLLAYKVLDGGGFGSTSDIIAALERAADPDGDGDPSDRADVINLSLGGPGTADDAASRAVDNATAAGIVVCVAAGNDRVTGSIGSPGVAASAITVGAIDDSGSIAPFSSRGPTPRDLAFKPDVTAPGVGIVSSVPGGGTAAASGTSMATPHVAGLAALLRELHPGWSPAEVKASLIAGAQESIDAPLARGAGRVDGSRAHLAPVVADVSSLAFGLRHETSGTWAATRTITLRNRSAQTHTYAVGTKGAFAGLQIAVSPATLQLAPGESKSVTVTATADNAALAFPDDSLLGGDIRFTEGTSAFQIPWGMVRGARVTVTMDFRVDDALALSARNRDLVPYADRAAEMIVPPAEEWTIVAIHDEPASDSGALTLVAAENLLVSGDIVVPLRLESAVHELRIEGLSPDGIPLHDLPVVSGRKIYLPDLRIMFRHPQRAFDYAFFVERGVLRTNSLSTQFAIVAREAWIDLEEMRAFEFNPEVQQGVVESKTIPASSPYGRARLEWEHVPSPTHVQLCNQTGLTIGTFSMFGSIGCASTTIEGPFAFELHATAEPATDSFSGLKLIVGRTETQTFRGVAGAIVASDEMVVPVTAHRIADGASAVLANGVAHPFFYIGTGVAQFSWPFWGVRGAFGELYGDPSSADWEAADAAGTIIARGIYGEYERAMPPPPHAGGRFTATRRAHGAGGPPSRATIEARFGANPSDLVAPAFTSLRIVGATGEPTGRLAPGEAGALLFSAADYGSEGFFRSQPSRPEATRVFYRVAGAAEWVALPVVVTGSETGERRALGHYPAGDVYRVDLSAATAAGASAIDLRVELEDAAGNRLMWLQQPAVVVGAVPAPVKRRPAARG